MSQPDGTERAGSSRPDSADDAADDAQSREALATQVDLLAEENARLRREYARAQRSTYRRTAVGLATVGVASTLAGVVFPASRPVLFVLGAIGLFGGVLTYYLTPERFVVAAVGERVYAALAETVADIVADLGLSDERVYLPAGSAVSGPRLFVPQQAGADLPPTDALSQPFVITDDTGTRGMIIQPTGGALLRELEQALSGSLADTKPAVGAQLTDGLVEQFELVDSTRVEIEDDRVSVGVTGSVYGDLDRFDHPVVSLLAAGFAAGLDQPVTATVTAGDDRVDYTVTLRVRP